MQNRCHRTTWCDRFGWKRFSSTGASNTRGRSNSSSQSRTSQIWTARSGDSSVPFVSVDDPPGDQTTLFRSSCRGFRRFKPTASGVRGHARAPEFRNSGREAVSDGTGERLVTPVRFPSGRGSRTEHRGWSACRGRAPSPARVRRSPSRSMTKLSHRISSTLPTTMQPRARARPDSPCRSESAPASLLAGTATSTSMPS